MLEETHAEVHHILPDIEATPGLGPLDALESYVRRQIEYNIEHLQKVSIYYHDFERLSEERQQKIVTRRREHERWVVDRVVAAQDAGVADPAFDAKMASHSLFAVIIWIYRWYQPRRARPELVVDASTRFAMNAITGGVAR